MRGASHAYSHGATVQRAAPRRLLLAAVGSSSRGKRSTVFQLGRIAPAGRYSHWEKSQGGERGPWLTWIFTKLCIFKPTPPCFLRRYMANTNL